MLRVRIPARLAAATALMAAWVATAGLPPAHAAFPGRNGKIVFERGRGHIAVMRGSGSHRHDLTTHGTYMEPSFSADARRIVFASYSGQSDDIFVMNASGRHRHRLTNTPTNDTAPSFSPNGHTIVFTRNRQIYAMRANGTHVRPLGGLDGRSFYPSYSPDGSRIVFSAIRRHGGEIYTMHSDGTHLRQLTENGPGARSYFPHFSPDGKSIVFSYGLAVRAHLRVCVMTARGADRQCLTRHGGLNFADGFSPDGKRIIYTHDEGGSVAVCKMFVDGSQKRQLTPDGMIAVNADWGPRT